MAKQTATERGYSWVRFRRDMHKRVQKVAIKQAAVVGERINDIDMYEEIIEEGLKKRERKLQIL